MCRWEEDLKAEAAAFVCAEEVEQGGLVSVQQQMEQGLHVLVCKGSQFLPATDAAYGPSRF
jgi:hypothetical protein